MSEEKKKVYIAGAHSRGRTLRAYLEYLDPNLKVEAFLVDDMSENAETVDGLPVLLIGQNLHTEYPVYLGMRGVNHEKVSRELREAGSKEIIPVTVELDMRLRNEYVRRHAADEGRMFRVIDELSAKEKTVRERTARIYVASSVFDRPLQDSYSYIKEELPLQVGAALTKERVSQEALLDCEGDNISERNRQFCELTGLYWIWKNACEDYIGLVHYRRHFLLPDNWLERIIENKIDVILPVPLYVAPSIAENYQERHIASDWKYLMEYFKTKIPEEYEEAEQFFCGNLYSPCNMFIARKEVLNRLCEWMFPILFAVAEHGGEKEDPYLNRYPGFISERLITYFFESRRKVYRVVYANKNFLK
ncbi:MAG: DUF4422 domain-containing protein [Lachnospiraceae bacterium]|nr:DUF4422 domain-containing protein [Lachnospiraceae bacterium]